MVAMRTLVGIAAWGGMITSVTGYTLHNILQNRVCDSPVFQESMKIINNHPGVISLLGNPIKSTRIDLGNKNNVLLLRQSTLEVPVQGPKANGTLFIKADRLTDEDQWNIYSVQLEILDSSGGKLSIVNKQPLLAKD